jgi:hypothetical protein
MSRRFLMSQQTFDDLKAGLSVGGHPSEMFWGVDVQISAHMAYGQIIALPSIGLTGLQSALLEPIVVARNRTADPIMLPKLGMVIPAKSEVSLSDYAWLHEIAQESALDNPNIEWGGSTSAPLDWSGVIMAGSANVVVEPQPEIHEIVQVLVKGEQHWFAKDKDGNLLMELTEAGAQAVRKRMMGPG